MDKRQRQVYHSPWSMVYGQWWLSDSGRRKKKKKKKIHCQNWRGRKKERREDMKTRKKNKKKGKKEKKIDKRKRTLVLLQLHRVFFRVLLMYSSLFFSLSFFPHLSRGRLCINTQNTCVQVCIKMCSMFQLSCSLVQKASLFYWTKNVLYDVEF